MTSSNARRAAVPHRISGPGELLQAVPYLLGFHPQASLVLVGLDQGRLVVTARLDLDDVAASGALVAETLAALRRGGTGEVVAAVYDDRAVVPGATRGGPLPWAGLAASITAELDRQGTGVVDVLLVVGDRWWSFTCDDPGCCPPDGRSLPEAPSAFAAAATVAGVVALPDRAALEALLDPVPDAERAAVHPALEAAEQAAVAAVLQGQGERHARAVKRAVFAVARAASGPRWPGPAPDERARFGAALAEIPLRDSVWLAIDGGRLDGRELWRDLARTLPSPYDAPPLFLLGWAAWRRGDGALAGMAAERAVASDPDYSAADLLLAALSRGVDPRRLPRLRLPRSA